MRKREGRKVSLSITIDKNLYIQIEKLLESYHQEGFGYSRSDIIETLLILGLRHHQKPPTGPIEGGVSGLV